MLAQRIAPASFPAQFEAMYSTLAFRSGGIPRMFLQLIADAATNARLRRHGHLADRGDLQDAVVDLQR